jgi:hypothetical protein
LWINRFNWKFLDKVSPKTLIVAFLGTKIPFWLPIIKKVLIRQGNAVIVTENFITLYGGNEPIEIPVADRELGQQIKDVLVSWLDELS